MSVPVSMPSRGRLPWHTRLAALLAVAFARLLAGQPPQRIGAVLRAVRKGARPATAEQAAAARHAVTTVSLLCAGEGCLPRSLATTLLCRMRGVWPTWCTGVRTAPFAAHAWVEVDGQPVEEPFPTGYHRVVMSVPPG